MSRIEQLGAAHIDRFDEFVTSWTRIGLCTDPADRPRAEAAIREIYRYGGLKAPPKIEWCGSPMSLVSTLGNGGINDNIGANVKTKVWSNIWARGAANIWARVSANIRASIEANVASRVEVNVGVNVGYPVRNSIGISIGKSFSIIHGAHDAAWLAFHRYCYDVLGLEDETAKLAGLWELAKSAGYVLPHEHMCWISERHNILSRDDVGRLHSLSGPACAWPDGWSIYAVHGVCVPRHVVEQPAKLSVMEIDAERNAEVRRVMIERYRYGDEMSGAAAYMRDAGGERIDHDERFGTLWRRNRRDEEPIVMVEVVNATREPDGRFKRYWLQVPPHITNAHEAVAWTFDLEPTAYAPRVET